MNKTAQTTAYIASIYLLNAKPNQMTCQTGSKASYNGEKLRREREEDVEMQILEGEEIIRQKPIIRQGKI